MKKFLAPKYQTAYACEGKKLTIECEPGDLINLIRANYGRFSITICNDHGNMEWSVNCMFPKSLTVLNSRCAHKQSCSVLATTSMFGDPCPGTHKYLEAHYQCISALQTSTTTSRPSPPPWVLSNGPPLLPNGSSSSIIPAIVSPPLQPAAVPPRLPLPGASNGNVVPPTVPNGGIWNQIPSSPGPPTAHTTLPGGRLKAGYNQTASKSPTRHDGLPPPPQLHHHHHQTGSGSTGAGHHSNADVGLKDTNPTHKTVEETKTNKNSAAIPTNSTSPPNTRILTGVGGTGSDDGILLTAKTTARGQQQPSTSSLPIDSTTTSSDGTNNSSVSQGSSGLIRTINNINVNIGLGGEDETNMFCRPTNARNLFWNVTRVGDVNVQPCPGGATGIAKWRCVLMKRISLDDEYFFDTTTTKTPICNGTNCDTAKINSKLRNFEPTWHPLTPDLTQCRSLWLNNLEVRVNQRDSSLISIANDLSEVTSSKTLYGGDMLVTTKIIQTMSEKMFHDKETSPDQHLREAMILELLQGVVKTGSNLLDESQLSSWLDLNQEDQMRVATSLLTGLEDNAFLLADTIIRERNVVQKVKNILLSVRVLETKSIQNNEIFPDVEQWQISDDRIELPRAALIENSEGGLVRIVFAAFDRLESILKPSYDHFDLKTARSYIRNTAVLSNDTDSLNSVLQQRLRILNSKVISASLGKGRHIQLSQPIKLILRHLKVENVTNPTCVFWNYIDHAWSANGCVLESTNRTHSVCMCNHLTNFAILMDVLDEHTHSLFTMFDGNMRILIYVSISICLVFIIIALLTLKIFNGIFIKVRPSTRTDPLSHSRRGGSNRRPNNIVDQTHESIAIANAVANTSTQISATANTTATNNIQQLQQQLNLQHLQNIAPANMTANNFIQHNSIRNSNRNNLNANNFHMQQQLQQQQQQQVVAAAAAAVVVANSNQRNLQMNNLNLNLNLQPPHNHGHNLNHSHNNSQMETSMSNTSAAAVAAAATIAAALQQHAGSSGGSGVGGGSNNLNVNTTRNLNHTFQSYTTLTTDDILLEVDQTSKVNCYYLLSYGLSFTIVAISSAINPNTYTQNDYCVLMEANTLFYVTFITPIMFFLMGALCYTFLSWVIMCRKSRSALKNKEHTRLANVRFDIRCSFIFLILLCTVWSMAYLYLRNSKLDDEAAQIYGYLFISSNTLMGIYIFVFHCIQNEKIRREYRKYVRQNSWLPKCLRCSKTSISSGIVGGGSACGMTAAGITSTLNSNSNVIGSTISSGQIKKAKIPLESNDANENEEEMGNIIASTEDAIIASSDCELSEGKTRRSGNVVSSNVLAVGNGGINGKTVIKANNLIQPHVKNDHTPNQVSLDRSNHSIGAAGTSGTLRSNGGLRTPSAGHTSPTSSVSSTHLIFGHGHKAQQQVAAGNLQNAGPQEAFYHQPDYYGWQQKPASATKMQSRDFHGTSIVSQQPHEFFYWTQKHQQGHNKKKRGSNTGSDSPSGSLHSRNTTASQQILFYPSYKKTTIKQQQAQQSPHQQYAHYAETFDSGPAAYYQQQQQQQQRRLHHQYLQQQQQQQQQMSSDDEQMEPAAHAHLLQQMTRRGVVGSELSMPSTSLVSANQQRYYNRNKHSNCDLNQPPQDYERRSIGGSGSGGGEGYYNQGSLASDNGPVYEEILSNRSSDVQHYNVDDMLPHDYEDERTIQTAFQRQQTQQPQHRLMHRNGRGGARSLHEYVGDYEGRNGNSPYSDEDDNDMDDDDDDEDNVEDDNDDGMQHMPPQSDERMRRLMAIQDADFQRRFQRHLRKQNGVHENSGAPPAYHDYHEAQYPSAGASSQPQQQQHQQPQLTVFGVSSGAGGSVRSFKKTASVSGSRLAVNELFNHGPPLPPANQHPMHKKSQQQLSPQAINSITNTPIGRNISAMLDENNTVRCYLEPLDK
uniref:Latrophilin Cirl n=1 Tax=Glossina morsitans morsitans TaxID=37546 RepID=A0A1B0G2T9_GLOMM